MREDAHIHGFRGLDQFIERAIKKKILPTAAHTVPHKDLRHMLRAGELQNRGGEIVGLHNVSFTPNVTRIAQISL